MAGLEKLVKELSKNPNIMRSIEAEVNRLAFLDDCSALFELQMSKTPGIHIFLCKILELKIKRKITTLNLQEEIQFTTQLLKTQPSHQVVEVFSLLGLYCWPTIFPSFIDETIALLNCETGYHILYSFLEKLNSNVTIDEKRRTELKKAMGMIYPLIYQNFNQEFARTIIQIYTELLKILPKNFDYSLVFEKAAEFPDEVIVFIMEAFSLIDHSKVIEVLSILRTDSGLIQVLSNLKMSKVPHPEKVYEYVFRGLDDHDCFLSSLDFWQRVFSSPSHSSMIEPVLSKILESYLSVEEDEKEEVDQHIFGFFTVVTRNYPDYIQSFLKVHGDVIPIKIASNFLQKLVKNENSAVLLSGLTFKSPYLNCLVSYLRKDLKTTLLVPLLDFRNKEDVKLALSVMSEFDFSNDQVKYILKMCDAACLNANEIKVECFLRLGLEDSFEGPWDLDKIIRYFYYLKKKPEVYIKYRDVFYSIFLESAPFDRCFAIIEKLGNVPDFILENIYTKMDKYPFIDLSCFNNDLLGYIPNPKVFVEKEVLRFVTEWNSIPDHKDFYLAVNSLFVVFNSKLDVYEMNLIDCLLDLIQIDSSIILNKVLSLFNSYKGKYNTRKALYYLISAYNLPNVTSSQPMISNSITNILYQDDGPVVFHEILGIDINQCCEVRRQILNYNKKNAQNVVKNLIKDFRGKSFSTMFNDEIKVTNQNFLPPKKREDSDCSLNLSNFL